MLVCKCSHLGFEHAHTLALNSAAEGIGTSIVAPLALVEALGRDGEEEEQGREQNEECGHGKGKGSFELCLPFSCRY